MYFLLVEGQNYVLILILREKVIYKLKVSAVTHLRNYKALNW